ncbi:NUDIX domain-containing protein [Nocardioides panacisoli]|uniref:NUDIX domain-containing protein n=1 Tax=Nocardioides panacisoli TaxID=627624 RepID=UPI001C62ED17|nr:NUDIX domain-containing protein [Nocardioides panacisoli]QYJ05718.1 NUDIX domain-containing protein [Nocardioides panacisoli]
MSGALHADALATLQAWTPPGPRQAALQERYVAHLVAHPDGLWRSCVPDHVTAGTLVIAEDAAHVLLNLHRKAQRWFHFGGHCEPGDTSLAGVAAREAREESGIADLDLLPGPAQLDEHVVSFCGDHDEVHHLDVRYLAVAPAAAREAASEESLAVQWWPVDALPDLEPEMLDLIAAARHHVALRG